MHLMWQTHNTPIFNNCIVCTENVKSNIFQKQILIYLTSYSCSSNLFIQFKDTLYEKKEDGMIFLVTITLHTTLIHYIKLKSSSCLKYLLLFMHKVSELFHFNDFCLVDQVDSEMLL